MNNFLAGDELPISVETKGALVVNDAMIVEASPQLLAVAVDFKSKRGEVGGWIESNEIGPIIIVEPVEDSVDLHPTATGGTAIQFPTLKGYSVFCCSMSRYTLRACFIKETP